ncbi:multiheme c-type cytochrome [Sphingomonas sp. C3-2]|uniref:multiheme c-type cytochrome n=1 Tax=Sphingomonas sp. C3-2 TaxID=3062169 RepID=UPI00294B0490|nr:multiheme c-type cytochrome [Sphingomonas sp. C3-2]WOK36554.1 multiheme c-type cytochrome [Sphingomonas sp. C3-2]
MGARGLSSSRYIGAFVLFAIMAMVAAAIAIGLNPGTSSATAQPPQRGVHLGVASCAGSTCHGRQEADGKIVRQDELMRWQEPSSAGGAHSRAFDVLSNARSQKIAARLGIGPATSAPMCLGCHSAPASQRGPRFQASDGVGCESCHGGASNWISAHYSVGASHRNNVALGMIPLENPRARASVCLDCHFGSAEQGQFVDHRIMAAGHPRISFELDLFSTLQQHHDEDADYAQRKGRSNNVRFWAVGQAMALERALTLYANPRLGQEGIFPEFYFFDCHTCHRQIFDDEKGVKTGVRNPGRPIPEGMPAFNDENMIMLSAAARVVAPDLGRQFDADSRAFHAALAQDRGAAVTAAARLRASAGALADRFASSPFGTQQSFAIVQAIASEAITPRFTDYEGSVQAVMAVDTLLNALVNGGSVSATQATAIRRDINAAYAAVKDPNGYRPAAFRQALGGAARSIGALK